MPHTGHQPSLSPLGVNWVIEIVAWGWRSGDCRGGRENRRQEALEAGVPALVVSVGEAGKGGAVFMSLLSLLTTSCHS